MYLLCNTNFLIPIIKHYDSLEDSLRELQIDTMARTQDYNDKIYVIQKNNQNIIYTSDGKHIYLTNLISGIKTNIFTNKKVNYNGNEYLQQYYSSNSLINNLEPNTHDVIENLKISDDMNITINEKKNKNIRFVDDNILTTIQDITNKTSLNDKSLNMKILDNVDEQTNNETDIKNKNKIKDDLEKEKKRNEIIKMIEEVNDLYQKELSTIKKLELNLKTYDSKLKKLEKTKKDNIINEIIRTQSEYRTWKKIKYGLKNDYDETDILKPIEELEESNTIVPILFLSKYNFIEKIQNNVSMKKLLDEINQLNLNDLYYDNSLPNENIVQFCNKYMKLSKELHYHFDDHEWNYLENEMNLNSTNKLGSNIISSNKF
jgi:hypothetical protein